MELAIPPFITVGLVGIGASLTTLVVIVLLILIFNASNLRSALGVAFLFVFYFFISGRWIAALVITLTCAGICLTVPLSTAVLASAIASTVATLILSLTLFSG